jgi:hypothetical protein
MTAGSLIDRRRHTLAGEDLDRGHLAIPVPRTARELAECMRRRDRYRRAICRWAVGQATVDRFSFHAGREAVRMVRLFGLTLADDEKIRTRAETKR